MRSLLPLAAFALLWSCGSDPAPATDAPATVIDTIVATPMVTDWPGYYDGTLPCADCPGIVTQLWVRSDSTFILRQRYLGKDSLAFGTIGQWHLVQPATAHTGALMTIGIGTDKPDFWRYTAKGIEMVDEMGTPFEGKLNYTLEKLADELQDQVPRMRLQGTFTYMADAMSFQPCGSHLVWPCGGGRELAAEEEGEVLNSMTSAELERAYRKGVKEGGKPWSIEVEGELGMGPAMEGDGADEYIFIHRVIREGVSCP